MKEYTLGSLFDGIGAFPMGASFFGVKTLWASEILPEAVSVTKRHFPDMLHVGDITKLSGELLPPVDIITFGSPCQDLSTASGKRAGLLGERSGLFMEAIRIIDEMREATNGKYPRYAIWENVPGCFSSNSRSDYQAVLQAFTKTEVPMPKSGRWANAGMVRSDRANIAWAVYNAAEFSLAQRRKRVFVVVDFGKGCPEEILLVPKSLCWNPPQSGDSRERTTAAAQSGAGSSEPHGVAAFIGGAAPKAGLGYSEKVSPTLRAGPGSTMTPFVCEPVILNDQGGDSLNVEKSEVSPTLRSQTHGHLPVVVHPEIAGTLCASAAGLSRPGGMGSETDLTVAYCLQGSMIGRADTNGPAGSGINKEVSFCLNSVDRPAVLASGKNATGTLCANAGAKQWSGNQEVFSGNYHVINDYVVRRLTPTECEALMGFETDYTKYGYDGSGTDGAAEISDSKRYSMLGNSIAVPCVAYIMQGILEQYRREETADGG